MSAIPGTQYQKGEEMRIVTAIRKRDLFVEWCINEYSRREYLSAEGWEAWSTGTTITKTGMSVLSNLYPDGRA